MPEPKFKVGQKVILDQGEAAESVNVQRYVEATITRIDTGYAGVPFSAPVYQVSFGSCGRASVTERNLSRDPRVAE